MPLRKTLPPPHKPSARRAGRSPTPLEPIPIPDSPPNTNLTPRPPPIRRSLPSGPSERRGARSSTPVQEPPTETTAAPSQAVRRSPMRRPAIPIPPQSDPSPHLQNMTQAQVEAMELHMREERTRIMGDILARASTGSSKNKHLSATGEQEGDKEPISRWADEAAKKSLEAAAVSKAPEQGSGPTARTGDDPEMVRMTRELAMEGRKTKSAPKTKEGARPMKWNRKAFKKPDPSLVLTKSEHSASEAEEDESIKAVQPKAQEIPRGTVHKEGFLELSSTSQEGKTLAQWQKSVKEHKEKIVGKKIGATATKRLMRKIRHVPFADETTTIP